MSLSYFNHQFLKFRIQYYFKETKELLARHKLLIAFIICLLAPGIKNFQAIGIPFYALIDPAITFKAKSIYLISLCFCLLAMTNAQSSFINGGAFRVYLHTLYIPANVHKAIDFIILLLSLNIVWVAIFLGGVRILYETKDPLFISSQYCLYASTVFVLCTFLLNFLYKRIANGVVIFFVLFLVTFISTQNNWLLNFEVGIAIFLLCGFIVWTLQPDHQVKKYSFKTSHTNVLNGFNSLDSLKNIFIIQLAVLRKHRISFLIRFIACLALSLLILQIFNFQKTINNRQGVILVLINFQTYILSTLFILFEKGKLEHILFHNIFPYQKQAQPIKEIILVWTGLMLTLTPIFLLCSFSLKNYFSWVLIIFAMNGVVLAINRNLYTQSLRFCLFSSLLNTVSCCVVQFIFLGAYYG
jgi:hypothetical protein